jgi:hypothetical protein
VVEGGGPPRRKLPRSLVVGLGTVCAVVALVWAIVVVADNDGGTVATPTATSAADFSDEPSAIAPADPDARVRVRKGPGWRSLTLGGVPVSFIVPTTPGWINDSPRGGWTRCGSN